MTDNLPHLDEHGAARMVDVGAKAVTTRRAQAAATVRMQPATAAKLVAGDLPKGDALSVARIAGIMGAKRTADLIPLCHPVSLDSVDVSIDVDADAGTAEVVATATASERTGVEMEALVAVTTAALALYDMVKAVERGVVVEQVRLLAKTGGSRGDWRRT